MLWKIYFSFAVLFAVLAVLLLFFAKQSVSSLFGEVEYIVAFIALYSYVFNKKIFTIRTLKILFWVNLVWDILYLLYGLAPNDIILKNLSFFYGPTNLSTFWVIVLSLIDIPWIYAIYRLSKGKYLEKKYNVQSKGT